MTENLSEIDEARAFLFLFSDALFSSIDSVANTEVAAIEQYYPIWRARRRKFFTSMVAGPLAIIKEWNPSHRIPIQTEEVVTVLGIGSRLEKTPWFSGG